MNTDWMGMIMVALCMYGVLDGLKKLLAILKERNVREETRDHMLADWQASEDEEFPRCSFCHHVVKHPICVFDEHDGESAGHYICPVCEEPVEV